MITTSSAPPELLELEEIARQCDSGYSTRVRPIAPPNEFGTATADTNLIAAEVPMSDFLTEALELTGVDREGQQITLSDANPNYARIQTVGDRGRVVPAGSAWEMSYFTVFVTDDQIQVIVETFLASGIGEIGPRSVRAYQTSADIDHSGDVRLFADELANNLVELIEAN